MLRQNFKHKALSELHAGDRREAFARFRPVKSGSYNPEGGRHQH